MDAETGSSAFKEHCSFIAQGCQNSVSTTKYRIKTFHFNISDLLLAMSYRERPEFVPEEHGLGADFRLTNFSKLKG